MSRRHRATGLWVLLVTSALAGPLFAQPSAQDREQARNLMDLGDSRTAAKDYEAALKAYQGADAIMGVPTTAIEVARTLERLGRLVEARDAFVHVTRMPPGASEPKPFGLARANAERAAAELEPRIPTLTLELDGLPTGASAEILLDGATLKRDLIGLPMRVNPGEHRISGSSPGFSPVEAVATLVEGEAKVLAVRFVAEPTRASDPAPAGATTSPSAETTAEPSRTLMWLGFGVGAAGIGAGSVTGALSWSRASAAKEQCEGTRCFPSAQEDIDASKKLATVANVSFAVGIVGTGVGIWQLIATQGGSSDAEATGVHVEPFVGFGRAGVTGRF